jgi:arsenite-transporting ATPase
MEIDPSSAIQEMVEQCTFSLARSFSSIPSNKDSPFTADSNGMMGSMMQDLAFAIPGVDEAMSFAEIMKSVFLWMSGF